MKFLTSFFTAILFCLWVLASQLTFAQSRPTGNTRPDTTVQADTLKKSAVDSLKKTTPDTIQTASGLTGPVDYSAEDSTILVNKKKLILLYGNARVKYENFELSAAFIRLDQEKNTIEAWGTTDKRTGRYTNRPIFKKDADPPVMADTVVYNYETEKASITNVSTEVEGGFIQAEVSKKNQYDEISLDHGKYSTCNLPHPHFYIASSKMLQTDKQVIFGPAYLVIEDVPFPAFLPFGFFPKVNKRSSGILFPTFGEDGVKGFFMRDLGYYIGLNDYWDGEVRGSLYSKGSYETSLSARYRKNYKYNGNLQLNYASTRLGIEGTPQYKPDKNFHIQWTHSQSSEARPGTTFSANVNAGTSSYNQVTAAGGTYDVRALTTNVMSSRISYGRTFANGLLNFTSGLGHSQNISTKDIQLTLPEFSLTMNSFSPFASKSGGEKWYQRITLGYSASGSNSISTKEYLLFKPGTLQKFNNGMMHNIPISFSSNVAKYFQFSGSGTYTERWTLQTLRKVYVDSLKRPVDLTERGFARAGSYNLSGSFSTKVYGTVLFKNPERRLQAVRHTMTPQLGFSYNPDFSAEKYGYYRNVRADSAGNVLRYSIFEGSLYGAPSAGKSGAITFGLDNTIEAKVRGKGDTATTTKVPIIQGLSFGGSYNLAADRYRLSNIDFSGRTAIFQQKLGLNFSGSFDPYSLDSVGNRIDRYLLRDGRGLVRLTRMTFSTDFSFNSAAAKSRNETITEGNQNREKLDPNQADALNRISTDPNAFVDFNIPWNINMSYSLNYSKEGFKPTVTNTLNFTGDFNLTPKWKIQYYSGYDFRAKKLGLTSFSIYRDLHCWDLSFSWVPFGLYRSFSMDLKVRASILQDLKLSKRRDYYANY